MFWLARLATTGSKSVLHLPYFSSPTCHFLSHLSLPFPSPFQSKLCAPTELSMCTRQAQVTLSFLRSLCERFQPLHSAGERWQEDWPPPKTSAGSCATGLYWPPGLHRETQKLPTRRTLTQTLWHKTCWQILPSEQATDLFSQYGSATYQGYFKRTTILLDDHSEQFPVAKRPPTPCFTILFDIKQAESQLLL